MDLNIVISGLLILLSSFIFASVANNVERKAFIVYMGNALETESLAAEQHHNLLLEVIQDEEVARRSIIHSYGKSFNAFAAYLLPDEAQRLRENENVISVFPNMKAELLTTNSWNFMDMPLFVERNPQVESDIIVGVIDSGIDFDSPSFNDKGFGPPPSKWKGVCQVGANISGCNNKVIGARMYNLMKSANDRNPSVGDHTGHGTHVASTAAGVAVKDASYFGLSEGTARGGVPSARIAVYKVCHKVGDCNEADILAAIDDAIYDGVDILSLSLAVPFIRYFFEDVIAIGSFHAMKKGILTSAAAGNYGPKLNTLKNGAPWILNVGATFTDRQLRTPIIIGNRIEMGISWNFFNETYMCPLANTFVRKCAESVPIAIADDVKGKILYKKEFIAENDDTYLKNKGAAGFIFRCFKDEHYTTFSCLIPCACVHPSIGQQIENYISSTDNPMASIHKSIVVQNKSAPTVAPFSSRGPHSIAHSIIKPDIVAPGIEILAARSKYLSWTGNHYTFMSGTSASCPHASGAAAYVKSFHPHWSPSAIKSALITTAYEMKGKDENAEFAYGAGHIHPTKALHPGLVYDMDTMDYVRFLCNLGYSEKDLERIIGQGGVDCSTIPKFGGEDDLNYPSMLLMQKDPHSNISAVFYRTVRNVGDANSKYKAKVTTSTSNVHITVTPHTLVFKEMYEEKSFTIEVKGPPLKSLNDNAISSSLIWTNSVYNVRSPILIFPAYKLEVNKTI